MGILQRFTLTAGLCAKEWMTSLLHSAWWCYLLCCVWHHCCTVHDDDDAVCSAVFSAAVEGTPCTRWRDLHVKEILSH